MQGHRRASWRPEGAGVDAGVGLGGGGCSDGLAWLRSNARGVPRRRRRKRHEAGPSGADGTTAAGADHAGSDDKGAAGAAERSATAARCEQQWCRRRRFLGGGFGSDGSDRSDAVEPFVDPWAATAAAAATATAAAAAAAAAGSDQLPTRAARGRDSSSSSSDSSEWRRRAVRRLTPTHALASRERRASHCAAFRAGGALRRRGGSAPRARGGRPRLAREFCTRGGAAATLGATRGWLYEAEA